jgi:hypothetical protein
MIKLLKKASIAIIGLSGAGVRQCDGAEGKARRIGRLPKDKTSDAYSKF